MLNDWEEHRLWAEPHVAPLRRYGDRVRLLHSAPLAEVRSWMKRAAIALVPSTWAEPFGLTALEAHAAGAALVSSGRGGLREASGPDHKAERRSRRLQKGGDGDAKCRIF